MLQIKAVFNRKDAEINATECVVEKFIRLPGTKFDIFSRNLMRDWDFLRDNPIATATDEEGRHRCLLVVGDGRRDGILVDAEGGSYARHSAFLPNAEDFLTAGRYQALAALNKKIAALVDYIAKQAGTGIPEGRGVVDLRQSEIMSGIDLMANGALLRTVLDMLDERPEIKAWELDKNELAVYREPEAAPTAKNLTDPAVSRADMQAYGYGWDGMIPLGKGRALEPNVPTRLAASMRPTSRTCGSSTTRCGRPPTAS